MNVKKFKATIKDDYIYGYVFYSGRHRSLVLDCGEYEFPIDEAFFLNDGKYIYKNDLSNRDYHEIAGSRARIKNTFRIQTDIDNYKIVRD